MDQHVHRRLKDAEGALFAEVLAQAGRNLGGRAQGVYIFAPGSGRLLAFANTADAGHVKRLMAKALDSFDPAAGGGDVVPAGAERAANRAITRPPEGVLIAQVTSKVLGGYEDLEQGRTAIHAESLGRDHLWIRGDEATALAEGTVPDSLVERIARFHLVDNTRGEPPFWRRDEVREAQVDLSDDGRLTGHVDLRTADGARGFRAELFGRVESRDGTLTRFDLVADGLFHGEGRYTRGAPEGEFPFAVSIRLLEPESAADRVVPGAARGNVAGYLGVR